MKQAASKWRRLAALAAGVAVLTALVIVVQMLGAPRQSAVRAIVRGKAGLVAQGAKIYAQEHGGTPRIVDLWSAGMIHPTVLQEFSAVELTGVAAGDAAGDGAKVGEVPLMVQVKPSRAVKKGEAWGGPGETTQIARPAVRCVLMSDWTVVEMDEAEYQSTWAAKVKLLPWE